MVSINYWAVIVSTVFSMILGVIWYTPLTFGNVWMKLVGMKAEEISSGAETAGYITAAVSHFIGALALAVFINLLGITGWTSGLLVGVAVSICFISTSRATNYVYERQPFALFLINSGYNVLFYAVAGILLAVWQ